MNVEDMFRAGKCFVRERKSKSFCVCCLQIAQPRFETKTSRFSKLMHPMLKQSVRFQDIFVPAHGLQNVFIRVREKYTARRSAHTKSHRPNVRVIIPMRTCKLPYLCEQRQTPMLLTSYLVITFLPCSVAACRGRCWCSVVVP